MSLANFPLGPLQTNSYLLHTEKQAVVIDVGGDPAPILHYLDEHQLQLEAICITHLHFDHLYGVKTLQDATQATVFVPAQDAPLANTEVSQGGIWGFPPVPSFSSTALDACQKTLAGMDCSVLSTPGHSPGSLSFYFSEQKIVFTGDALFYRSVGRTDFPGGNEDLLIASIHDKLFTLPAETLVYPGHGPATTIGDEKRNNPICGVFAM